MGCPWGMEWALIGLLVVLGLFVLVCWNCVNAAAGAVNLWLDSFREPAGVPESWQEP